MKALTTSLVAFIFLTGCIPIETNYSKCHSSSDNFPETFECIKKSQIKAYDVQNSPWITNTWKCGETLSKMVVRGELSDQQAWYLFNWATDAYSSAYDAETEYQCIDWGRLKEVEAALKERKLKEQIALND